jgi:hypothetical protein
VTALSPIPGAGNEPDSLATVWPEINIFLRTYGLLFPHLLYLHAMKVPHKEKQREEKSAGAVFLVFFYMEYNLLSENITSCTLLHVHKILFLCYNICVKSLNRLR